MERGFIVGKVVFGLVLYNVGGIGGREVSLYIDRGY